MDMASTKSNKRRAPGAGRPPRDGNNEPAKLEIKVMLTRQEKLALREKALLTGTSMAEVLRSAINS